MSQRLRDSLNIARRLRAIRSRSLALLIACAFCFVQQVAVMHYAATHGNSATAAGCASRQPLQRMEAGHRSAVYTSACHSLSTVPPSEFRLADECALCAFEANLLSPAGFARPMLDQPATLPIPPPSALAFVRTLPILPALLPASRAPPSFLSA